MITFSSCIQRYCPFQSISYDAQEDNIRTAVKKKVVPGGGGVGSRGVVGVGVVVLDEEFGQSSK